GGDGDLAIEGAVGPVEPAGHKAMETAGSAEGHSKESGSLGLMTEQEVERATVQVNGGGAVDLEEACTGEVTAVVTVEAQGALEQLDGAMVVKGDIAKGGHARPTGFAKQTVVLKYEGGSGVIGQAPEGHLQAGIALDVEQATGAID